jgi:hypothetical protein
MFRPASDQSPSAKRNAPEAVIANRYVDCKDVATLMSVLLAAKGIASEYALINTNPIYQLDATPQVGAFNHVIVYLPELDLYADPTAAVSFIGHLPRADRGKPVLRVSKHQVTRARTPIGTADDNTARISSHGADEIVHGETVVERSGEFAQSLRRFVVQSGGKSAQATLDTLGKQLNILSVNMDWRCLRQPSGPSLTGSIRHGRPTSRSAY